MPFLGSKYAKMLLRLGLCPGPRWGSLQRSSRPPSWIKGGLLLRGGGGEGKRKGRGGKGRGEGKGEEGKGKEGRRGEEGCCALPLLKFLDPPLLTGIKNCVMASQKLRYSHISFYAFNISKQHADIHMNCTCSVKQLNENPAAVSCRFSLHIYST